MNDVKIYIPIDPPAYSTNVIDPPSYSESEIQDGAPNLFFTCLSSCASMGEESCGSCVKFFFSAIWSCFLWLKSFFISPVRGASIPERGQVARFILRWENSDLSPESEKTKDAWMADYLALPQEPRMRARIAFIERYREEIQEFDRDEPEYRQRLLWNNRVLEAIQKRPKDPIILAELRSWSEDQISTGSIELD